MNRLARFGVRAIQEHRSPESASAHKDLVGRHVAEQHASAAVERDDEAAVNRETIDERRMVSRVPVRYIPIGNRFLRALVRFPRLFGEVIGIVTRRNAWRS
jgi:hypothetical protein